MPIKVFDLEAGIKIDETKFNQSMGRIEAKAKQTAGRIDSSFKNISKSIGKVQTGGGLLQSLNNRLLGGGLVAAGAGVVGGTFNNIAAGIKKVTNNVAYLSNLSNTLGVSVDELEKLRIAGVGAGVDFEDLANIMVKVRARIGLAAAGNAEFKDTFKQLGLSMQDLQGKTGIQQLMMTLKAFESLPSPEKKLGLATKLLEEQGAMNLNKLIGLSNTNLGGINTGLTDEAIKKLQIINKQQKDWNKNVEIGENQLTSLSAGMRTWYNNLANGLPPWLATSLNAAGGAVAAVGGTAGGVLAGMTAQYGIDYFRNRKGNIEIARRFKASIPELREQQARLLKSGKVMSPASKASLVPQAEQFVKYAGKVGGMTKKEAMYISKYLGLSGKTLSKFLGVGPSLDVNQGMDIMSSMEEMRKIDKTGKSTLFSKFLNGPKPGGNWLTNHSLAPAGRWYDVFGAWNMGSNISKEQMIDQNYTKWLTKLPEDEYQMWKTGKAFGNMQEETLKLIDQNPEMANKTYQVLEEIRNFLKQSVSNRYQGGF